MDIEAVRRAYEQRNCDSMIGFYAEEARLRIVNPLHPPSNPYVLSGEEQIAQLQRRLFVQDTKHHLQQKIVGNDKVAFHVMREYLDGERLLATAVQEPDERGKVVRHSEVQEFDE